MKKCWRTIDPVQEPSICIGPECMAYKNTQAFQGCAFVVAAHTTAVRNLIIIKEDHDRNATKTDITPETNNESETNS